MRLYSGKKACSIFIIIPSGVWSIMGGKKKKQMGGSRSLHIWKHLLAQTKDAFVNWGDLPPFACKPSAIQIKTFHTLHWWRPAPVAHPYFFGLMPLSLQPSDQGRPYLWGINFFHFYFWVWVPQIDTLYPFQKPPL